MFEHMTNLELILFPIISLVALMLPVPMLKEVVNNRNVFEKQRNFFAALGALSAVSLFFIYSAYTGIVAILERMV